MTEVARGMTTNGGQNAGQGMRSAAQTTVGDGNAERWEKGQTPRGEAGLERVANWSTG